MRLQGIAASPGYAIGRAVVRQERSRSISAVSLTAEQAERESERLQACAAAATVRLEALKEQIAAASGEEQARIFESLVMLLEDEEFIGAAEELIRQRRINAEAALQEVSDSLIRMFEGMTNEYMRERAADVRDVTERVMQLLQGEGGDPSAQFGSEPAILFARDLAPSDTAGLDREVTVGLAIDLGGKTSHSAIIARSLNIPAVVGLSGGTEQVATGDMVVVDGVRGEVYVNPPAAILEHYKEKMIRHEQRRREWQAYADMPTQTADLRRVELGANIGNPQEAYAAKRSGAEGVGLFRTELLYMGRSTLPSEEEQLLAYRTVAELFRPRPVIIRTLDIGGDKELPYLNLPREANPFLGHRAIRLCLDRPELFKTQLRAILRASAFGRVKIMYPMISTLEELRQANEVLREARAELDRERIPYDAALEVGLMIEVPAAALVADQLAKEADFFSIGTNDLVQYTMAADRMNEKVAHLSEPFNPAVLRLIRHVAQEAHAAGRWVGMCGEMAGNPLAVPILLGLGIEEFSMSGGSIVPVRSLLHKLSYRDAQALASEALQLETAAQIKRHIEERLPFLADWMQSV